VNGAREAFVAAALRTPMGRYGGALARVRPDDLAAAVIKALVERTGVDGAAIGDVFWGAANQAGEDCRNVARMAALLAGLPVSVPGTTVNRLCGSGLQAINSAAAAIALGLADVAIAGGSESMSRAPYVILKNEEAYARAPQIHDSTLGNRLLNSRLCATYPPVSLGETAENVARLYGITREEQDAFAYRSQQRAQRALEAGTFAREIVPVEVPGKSGVSAVVDADEAPRPGTTLEGLAKLPPAFVENGSVTAGNSSPLSDGAAALLLCSEDACARFGLRPLARVVTAAVAGVDPSVMGLGPIPATAEVLKRTGLSAKNLDLVEINEAFAAQALACMRDLELDAGRTNVNGGAIALGHPLGASGARIATTLLHELTRRRGRYGLATLCVGMGQGIATLFERP
jgi:3-oxoadipyl-CoA thiolase